MPIYCVIDFENPPNEMRDETSFHISVDFEINGVPYTINFQRPNNFGNCLVNIPSHIIEIIFSFIFIFQR